MSSNPTSATESGHDSAAVPENGSEQSAEGGDLVEAAATPGAQAESASGDGAGRDGAGAEAASDGGGGANAQMESHHDGQTVNEEAVRNGGNMEGEVAEANARQPGPDVSNAVGAGAESMQRFWAIWRCARLCLSL